MNVRKRLKVPVIRFVVVLFMYVCMYIYYLCMYVRINYVLYLYLCIVISMYVLNSETYQTAKHNKRYGIVCLRF